jgi:hypothetical protein
MKPISFSCEETLSLAPADIARQMLDLTKWHDFHGYGPIPGIKLDGSSHVEEIVEWQPDHRIRLHLKEFSAPLSRLATEFEETWELQRTGNETHVTRSFPLHAKSVLARLLL